MRNPIKKILKPFLDIGIGFFKRVHSSISETKTEEWFKHQGRLPYSKKNDKNLRYKYNLNENSIVFDLGGYRGQWTSDIFSMYCCSIYIFEPVQEYAQIIKERFERNKKVKNFGFGIGGKNEKIPIILDDDGSSYYKTKGKTEEVPLRDIMEIISENNIEKIDLIKINIEGGEYEVLSRLIQADYIKNIKNIQVQFHDLIEDAQKKRKNIQNKLSETHNLTYNYPWVWENWRIKDI
ncbi:MAG: FkbM family methyltransferase [Candidatus Lokiarchaeota archaeon]|nr:FkbM family methyltransferase [Candidatus Lokiarchaeota archaeon]